MHIILKIVAKRYIITVLIFLYIGEIMGKKDKKNKNEVPGVNPANPYEQEKKKHPILNFFIILFAVLLVIDIALLVLFFVNNGMPPNPNYAQGKWELSEGTIDIGFGSVDLKDANGKLTLTLNKYNAENGSGAYTMTFEPRDAGNTGGSDNEGNTGGETGGEGEGGETRASRAASITMNGTWTYEGGVVTLSAGTSPLALLAGDYQLSVPFLGSDSLVRETNAGKWVFTKA